VKLIVNGADVGAAAWGEVLLGDGGEIVTQNFDRSLLPHRH
jgi:hypothetical protein